MIWKSFKDDGGQNFLVSRYIKDDNQYVCKIYKIPTMDTFSLNVFHLGEKGDIVLDIQEEDSQTKPLIKVAETFLENL